MYRILSIHVPKLTFCSERAQITMGVGLQPIPLALVCPFVTLNVQSVSQTVNALFVPASRTSGHQLLPV